MHVHEHSTVAKLREPFLARLLHAHTLYCHTVRECRAVLFHEKAATVSLVVATPASGARKPEGQMLLALALTPTSHQRASSSRSQNARALSGELCLLQPDHARSRSR